MLKGAGEHGCSNDEEANAGKHYNGSSSSSNNISSSANEEHHHVAGAKSTGEPRSEVVDDAGYFSAFSSDKGEDESGVVQGSDVGEDEADSEAGVMEGVHPGLATYESQRSSAGMLGAAVGAGLEEYAQMLEQMQVRLSIVSCYVYFVAGDRNMNVCFALTCDSPQSTDSLFIGGGCRLDRRLHAAASLHFYVCSSGRVVK